MWRMAVDRIHQSVILTHVVIHTQCLKSPSIILHPSLFQRFVKPGFILVFVLCTVWHLSFIPHAIQDLQQLLFARESERCVTAAMSQCFIRKYTEQINNQRGCKLMGPLVFIKQGMYDQDSFTNSTRLPLHHASHSYFVLSPKIFVYNTC